MSGSEGQRKRRRDNDDGNRGARDGRGEHQGLPQRVTGRRRRRRRTNQGLREQALREYEERIEAERKARQQETEERIEAERKARQVEERLEAERKARQQETEERIEAARKARQQETKRRIEAERKVLESESLRNGTYYSTVDQVWGKKSVDFDETSFTRLIREGSPNFVPRRPRCTSNDGDADRGKLAVYEYTRKCALDDTLVAAEVATSPSSRSTLSSETKFDIWPKDIFGTKAPLHSEVAHLIPCGYNVSTLYRDVAICALGLEMNVGWDTTQKAIHGAKVAIEVAKAEELVDDATSALSATSTSRKLSRTGIKHFVPNKIRLSRQGTYLDQYPGVLIIPAMDVDAMKKWYGGGYKAIVMVGAVGTDDAGAVCAGIGMLNKGPVATTAQIERARKLLSAVTMGMAYSLKRRFKRVGDPLNDWQRKKIKDLRKGFTGHGVLVPKRRPEENLPGPLRVRLVKFASASSAKRRHPAPDPFLLAVRAAVNWSARHDQRLMASAEPGEYRLGGEDEDLDRLAEEEFLAWREELREVRDSRARNISWEELARRLGQPGGYVGDAVTVPHPVAVPETPKSTLLLSKRIMTTSNMRECRPALVEAHR